MKRLFSIKKQYILLTAMLLAACVLLSGCASAVKTQDTDSAAKQAETCTVYYLNATQTALAGKEYQLKNTGVNEQIRELIDELSVTPAGQRYQSLLPEHISITRYVYEDHQLFLYFNEDYLQMSPDVEVLARGGIVCTLLQIPGVSGVSFYVKDMPLTDASGAFVGVMSEDTFAIADENDPDDEITYKISLYFASPNGKRLVRESRTVTADDGSIEARVVLDELLRGPQGAIGRMAIPEDTVVQSVMVMDGEAVVDFSSEFLNQDYQIAEEVVIYSIVDSLTELPEISSVRISVDGNSNLVYRTSLSLSNSFTQNTELLSNRS